MSETPSGNGSKVAIRIAIVVALAVIAGVAIRHYTRSVTAIRVASVGYGDLITILPTSGKVEPIENFQAHAEEPGSVEAVYVRAGQYVEAGTLLLRLNSASADARVETARSAVAQAQAAQFDIRQGGSTDERIGLAGDLDRAKLQVEQTQSSLTALQALQAKGAASANEVASAQQRLATAQSQLASLQQRSTQRYAPTDKERVSAQMADSRAGLASAEKTLAQAVVRAPFAGTVYSLPVKQYDFVGAGEELVQLADLSRVQVLAYFDEPEIGKLRVGDAVVIKWDAKPTSSWHGHIVRTPTTVKTYGSRNVGECLITVDDSKGDLLPYTNVNVSVTTQQIYHTLSLPREALHTQGGNFVYLVQRNVLVRRPINVGALNLTTVQITGGLQAGDVVALNPIGSDVDLVDGLQVTVVKQ